MSEYVHNKAVKSRMCELYDDLIAHEGFAEMRVEIRLLKRGQKEIILHCNKQYRLIVDAPVLIEKGHPTKKGGGQPNDDDCLIHAADGVSPLPEDHQDLIS